MTDAVKIAVIVAAGPVATGLIGILQARKASTKLSEIHVLVNSRLSVALDEIASLKGVISRQASAADPK
jgi:hypothetical protein